MITLSELQLKEVIMMHNGKRLGYIDDLEIDENSGHITAIIIVERQMRGALFNKPTEKVISWDQIITIGSDIILVGENEGPPIEAPKEDDIE